MDVKEESKMTEEEAIKALDQLLETVGLSIDEAHFLMDWGARALKSMAEHDFTEQKTNSILYVNMSVQTMMALGLAAYLAQRDGGLEKDFSALIECSSWLAQAVVDILERQGLQVKDEYQFTVTRIASPEQYRGR